MSMQLVGYTASCYKDVLCVIVSMAAPASVSVLCCFVVVRT